MDFGNSLIGHCDLGKVGVLKEAVVWLLILDSQSNCSVHISLIPSCLRQDSLTALQHIIVAPVFILNCALDVL